MPPTLRVLADDLTGALDTAAELVGLCGPVEVGWAGGPQGSRPQSLAGDTGTRELAAAEARHIVEGLAPLLAAADIAYKKVDSLLRGPWGAELAACLRQGGWRRCIVASAFPHQGRMTRGGRQLARGVDGAWTEISGDLATALRGEGIEAGRARPGDPLGDGVTVVDARTEGDLDRIVTAARAGGGPVLWCGSGGLARALAHDRTVTPARKLRLPVLGLFGSDQRATAAQLVACREAWLTVAGGDEAAAVAGRLGRDGAAFVSVDLPAGTSRTDAARRIAHVLGRLALDLAAPGTLIVAGGETLMGLCVALGARSLLATGQVAPGLPRSIMRGGHWDGVETVSKSGAFGAPSLWRELLIENGLLPGRDRR